MFAYVGCYTSQERHGRGAGIRVFHIDTASATWTHVQLFTDLVNPSFLAFDRGKRFLYSVHGDTSDATAFAIDQSTGQLTLLNGQSTGGRNPTHLAVDPSSRFLIVANYGTGTLAALPINSDGSLAPLSDLATLPGDPGPHRQEQDRSHPHHVPFDPLGRFIVVPDLGLDKIFIYRLDTTTGKLVMNDPSWVTARAGAGPRHVDFHPSKPYAYVINELDSTIAAYHFASDRGQFTPLQLVRTLPANFTGKSTAAEIAVAPAGRYVYGSNRGHDSIAIFAIDQGTGLLTPVGWELTRGRSPRCFGLDRTGSFLYAANQDSDTIVTFRVDQATGQLTPTGQIVNTGSPSSITFR